MVETLLVVGIFTILVGLSSIGLSRLIPNTISRSSETTLLADLRQQQLKAQTGVEGAAHGVAFGSGEYVLFEGSTYNPSEPSNTVVALEEELTLSSTLPGNVVVFAALSGEPTGIGPFQDQVILTNNATNTIYTLEINELGVPLEVD
jgi:hypothetical protein